MTGSVTNDRTITLAKIERFDAIASYFAKFLHNFEKGEIEGDLED